MAEKYEPTPEEIKRAEDTMPRYQRSESERREDEFKSYARAKKFVYDGTSSGIQKILEVLKSNRITLDYKIDPQIILEDKKKLKDEIDRFAREAKESIDDES